MLSKKVFDYTKEGKTVTCYRITNRSGSYVEVLDYGGIIRALLIPDANGKPVDVVIGFDRLSPYIKNKDAYYGAFVGRYANRIAGGKFIVDGTAYEVEKNNGENHLHGGNGSFSERIGKVTEETDNSVTLTWESPDMDQGYPGNLTVSVRYEFDDKNTLTIKYTGVSDKDTLFNPTNHSYFNMNGPSRGYIGDNEVKVYADKFIPVDDSCIPTGNPATVKGALDMRRWTLLNGVLKKEDTDQNLQAGCGIDHSFAVRGYDGNGDVLRAAELYGPATGIRMSVSTNLPGLQIYSGNYIKDGLKGKLGQIYNRRCAICFESQFHPDSPNYPDWPSPVLKAGKKAEYTTVYSFDTPLKAVVLDGYTTNCGDISWEPLYKVCRAEIYDRTAPKDILKRVRGADVIITNKAVLTREIIGSLDDNCRYVGLLSTGANAVDIDALKEKGIALTNVPGYSTEDVAQLTFAFILELCQHVALHNNAVKDGAWVDSDDFSFTVAPIRELAGLTLGIIGYGAIGSRVCEIARAFHMKVLVHSRSEKILPEGARFVSKNELLKKSDIITLHLPLTEETRCLIDADAISMMKDGAVLINTARGPLLDEQAVADALNSGKLGGAGVDVLCTEPPQADNPLLSAENCLITPHIAWAAQAARIRLIEAVAKNLSAFNAGRKLNRID
ncbi:MAG: galactose-1-epimerase [Clostridia bacterium]|nr:galactose-1-epimerase [Clostridia bacterium]